MMKIKARIGDRDLVVLGLSHANLDRLRRDGLQGKIAIDGKELGLDVDIWITAAENEAVMLRSFEDGVRAGTKVHIDPRLKS